MVMDEKELTMVAAAKPAAGPPKRRASSPLMPTMRPTHATDTSSKASGERPTMRSQMARASSYQPVESPSALKKAAKAPPTVPRRWKYSGRSR